MNTIYVIKETHKIQNEEERKIIVSQKLAQVIKSDRLNSNHKIVSGNECVTVNNHYQL